MARFKTRLVLRLHYLEVDLLSAPMPQSFQHMPWHEQAHTNCWKFNCVSNLSRGASQSLERGTIDVFGLGAICLGGPGVVAPELIKMKEPTAQHSHFESWRSHTCPCHDLLNFQECFESNSPRSAFTSRSSVLSAGYDPHVVLLRHKLQFAGAVWISSLKVSKSVPGSSLAPGCVGGSERWTPIHKSLLESTFWNIVKSLHREHVNSLSHFAWAKWSELLIYLNYFTSDEQLDIWGWYKEPNMLWCPPNRLGLDWKMWIVAVLKQCWELLDHHIKGQRMHHSHP